jgi:hypothetical protein
MPKKTNTLYMSFVPVILLLVLIAGAGYFLLKDDFKLPKIFNNEPQLRRLEGFPTVVNSAQPIEKQRVVIKSQDELIAFLKTVDPTGSLALGEKINFDKEYLLGVAAKTATEGDTQIKIRKLYEDKKAKEILVSIREIDPQGPCVKTGQSIIPVDIVAISKTDDSIKFEVIKEFNSDCPNAQ